VNLKVEFSLLWFLYHSIKFIRTIFYGHPSYTHTNLTSCNKFVNKPSTKVVFALLVTSCQQVWNKLLTICNNLVNIIRLVTRLFQQVRYSHDIAVLLQPCVDNLVTFLFIMTVSDFIEQPCDKSDNAIKLVTSCYNSLLQTNLFTSCQQVVFAPLVPSCCNNLFADL
jgi:hypothetical protein